MYDAVVQEIKMLVSELNGAARKYYVNGEPPLSDAEYDREYARLEKLEHETGIVFSDSPTRNVGAEPDDPDKRPHARRMYSLDKVNGEENLEKRIDAILSENRGAKLIAEFKFDGISAELIYRKGFLTDALTRGNGIYGRSIYEHVIRMDSIPKQLHEPIDIDIRGEIYSSRQSFALHNQTATNKLKNERNATAGALAGQDYALIQSIGLKFVAYDVGEGGDIFKSAEELLDFCTKSGFDTGTIHIPIATAADAVAAVQSVSVMRDKLDFLIDGVVFKFSDYAVRNRLGCTDKAPRWAFAYKFAAEGEWTRLREIEWEPSKSGKLTPVAIFDPIEMGGTTVTRATLNNAAFVIAQKLGIGDDIYVERANDVIPRMTVHAPSYDSVPAMPPKECPVCGTELVMDGVHLTCPNADCPAQLAGRLAHFASRNGMNIKTLGEKMAQQLVDSGRVKHPVDIYSLTHEEMIDMGFSRLKTERFIEEVQISKGAALGNVIYALSIPGVGKGLAYSMGEQVLTYKALMALTDHGLAELDGVSATKAKIIYEFLHSDVTATGMRKYIINY